MRSYESGQWDALNRVLAHLNTYETKMVSKGDLYDDVMEMRPVEPLDYTEVGDETPNLSLLRPNKVDYRRIEEQFDWYRAGGDCICERCGMDYYSHPPVIGWTWLRRICNGDLIKL